MKIMKKKHGLRTLCALLCLLTVISIVPFAPVYAEDETIEFGFATVTLAVEKKWDDNSGYQLLLDAATSTFGSEIPKSDAPHSSTFSNGSADSALYGKFAYKLPMAADGNVNTSNTVRFGEKCTITVPAGRYDFVITNPVPGSGIYIAHDNGPDSGRGDDVLFEAGKHYTFTVSEFRSLASPTVMSDGVTLTVETSQHEKESYDCIWFEDFESGVLPEDFSNIDSDGDGRAWEVLGEDTYGYTVPGHHGKYAAYSESYDWENDKPLSPRNMIATPEFTLSEAAAYSLTFEVRPQDLGYSKEAFSVFVYSKKKEKAVEVGNYETVMEWKEIEVDLTEYAGDTVSVQIVHNNTLAQSLLMIDCFCLWSSERPAHSLENYENVWFESFDDSVYLPEGWTALDKDEDGHGWAVTDVSITNKFHHGNHMLFSDSYYNGNPLAPDDWLVLPEQSLEEGYGYVLTFCAVGESKADYKEVFGIFVSEDGGENYTQLGSDYTTTAEWQEIKVDLSEYAGKDIVIAIAHHNVVDQYSLLLDCFAMWRKADAAQIMIGDVNGDGKVDMKDLVTLIRYNVNKDWPGITFIAENADINQDSIINMKDIIMLIRKLV